MDYKIAVIKGDGIGPEITDQALLALDAVGAKFGHKFNYTFLLGGGAALDVHGIPLPDETVEVSKASDAVFLGAVGDPKWDGEPGSNRPEMAILGLRMALGLFANLRPALIFDELADASPIRPDIIKGSLDILIVRELNGGIYFGPKSTDTIEDGKTGDAVLAALNAFDGRDRWRGATAYDVEIYSEDEIRRIGKVAFEMAKKRGGRVMSVDKANVLESSRLWRRLMEEMRAAEYPDVTLEHMFVDNVTQQLIKNPKQFDVIVTSNMFGDIISDEASQITGSIGMLPSASLGEGSFGLYEPIHGSAPKYTGLDRANPIATILSAAMMLRYSFSLADEANAIEQAVSSFLKAGYRTPDIMAEGFTEVGTKKTGELIASFV
ncbi:MAG: 3-isopropylmalate dehydrogenase [Clostridiales Family XIII bacterium]|jgi:3-isopropylmalate dehydrogenase|nr:3-isopropylmalate dehydrogenase [Clostridiales Family XIII bacterium]